MNNKPTADNLADAREQAIKMMAGLTLKQRKRDRKGGQP